jgi:hypothetical protein
MLRTYLSLVVARLDGEIVRDLVAGNGRAFIWGIIKVSWPLQMLKPVGVPEKLVSLFPTR